MFKNNRKNKITLLAVLALAICLAVGGTLAYILDISGIVTNAFDPGVVTTEVTETLDGDVKSDVAIKNTGNVEAYLRATIVVNWKNAAGDVYGKYEPVASTATEINDYTLVLQEYDELDEAKWIQGSDGLYYWTKPVLSDDEDANNCSTGALIASCTMNNRPADLPEGYTLSVEILGSGIQSRPDAAVERAWPAVQVNDDTKLLELKPAGN